MTEEIEFKFKQDCDMNELVNQIKESIIASTGSDISKVKCKGICIFFVDEASDMLMSSGLFVKGFSPEDWDDEP